MNYFKLIELRETALWQCESFYALGIYNQSLRYYRLLNWIEDRMRNYKPSKQDYIN